MDNQRARERVQKGRKILVVSPSMGVILLCEVLLQDEPSWMYALLLPFIYKQANSGEHDNVALNF